MNLNITIIQSELYWEDAQNNLKMFAEKIKTISKSTDLIVLPEMFTTGFSMKSEQLAEQMNGNAIKQMKIMANEADAVIIGSLIIQEDNHYFNRLLWMQPNGKYYTYDKRHLFRMAGEHESYSAGQKRLIVNYKGWRICPMICYDLRFPVWSRNIDAKGNTIYDCLIYIANWPSNRKAPWKKLLEARAIENQCYVVGVNRIGNDGNNIKYSGNSTIINPKGEPITNIPENENCIQTNQLSLTKLNNFRAKFPVDMDADKFRIV